MGSLKPHRQPMRPVQKQRFPRRVMHQFRSPLGKILCRSSPLGENRRKLHLSSRQSVGLEKTKLVIPHAFKPSRRNPRPILAVSTHLRHKSKHFPPRRAAEKGSLLDLMKPPSPIATPWLVVGKWGALGESQSLGSHRLTHEDTRAEVYRACLAGKARRSCDKCTFWKTPNIVEAIDHVVFKIQKPSPEDHSGMEGVIWELLRGRWRFEPSDRPHMVNACEMLSAARDKYSTGFYPACAGPSPTFYSPICTRCDRPRGLDINHLELIYGSFGTHAIIANHGGGFYFS